MKLLVMHFSPFTRHLILFGPTILISTLFSNNLSLCSPLNVRDQVSHPYRKAGKIIVFYIRHTLCTQEFPLTSHTNGGHSVGIVLWLTKATELLLLLLLLRLVTAQNIVLHLVNIITPNLFFLLG
jgi:hypothetical protein